jgi:23S rRNA (adenine2503-C2)-methyltransferase
MTQESLLDLTPLEARARLHTFVGAQGQPLYRVEQIMPHLWKDPVRAFDQITVLPLALRNALAQAFTLRRLAIISEQRSLDGTRKFLFDLGDGQQIETVAIPEGKRMTLCLSSQAGCALQCSFCATGAMGFARNLTVSEIACQVRELALLDPPIAPTNIVFMGMGEPMMNWKAVDSALSILNSEEGFGIGARHITVSTVGVLPGIEALAKRPEQFRLAISIHAPADELRRSLMPINVKYPLSAVVQAAAAFHRRVTFEYVMLGGVNDQPEHARQLAQLARQCGAFVNLIPLHPGGAGVYQATVAADITRFATEIRRQGVEVAVRKSRGVDIAAACGQLRAERARRRRPVGANEHSDVDVAG